MLNMNLHYRRKRFFAAVMVLTLVLSLIAPHLTFSADEPFQLPGEGTTTVAAYDYTRSSGNIRQESVYLSFQANQWVEYDVVAPADGTYHLFMKVGRPSDVEVSVLVNGIDSYTETLESTGGYVPTESRFVATIQLSAGKNTIRITNSSAGGYYFESVSFDADKAILISNEGTTTVSSAVYSDSSGGIVQEGNALSFQTDQWVEYDVIVPSSGLYNLYMTVGMPEVTGEVSVLVNDTDSYTGILTPTGAYESTLPRLAATIQLTAGKNSVRITNIAGGYDFESISFELEEAVQLSEEGITTIESYNYSRSSGDIRQESVYLSFQANQWTEYDVVAPVDGEFNLFMTVGMPINKQVAVLVNGTDSYTGTLESTGGYLPTETRFVATIQLSAGKNTIRITNNNTGGYYFESVSFDADEAILISNEGTTTISSDVYIDSSGDIVQEGNVVSFQTDQWVEYDVIVPASGVFNLYMTVGMPEVTGEVSVLVNDADSYTGTLAPTGAYDSTLPRLAATVQLTAGKNSVRITNGEGGYYFESVSFEPIEMVTLSDKDTTIIAASDYFRSSDDIIHESIYLSLQEEEWVEYDVIVTEDSTYNLFMTVGMPEIVGQVTVLVNGEESYTGTLAPTGDFDSTMMRYAASIQLKAGINSIRITNEVGEYYFEAISFDTDEAIILSEEDITTVAAYDYMRSSDDIDQEGTYLSFQTDQWVEYDIITPSTGVYDLFMTVGMPETAAKVDIFVNDADSYAGTLAPTGNDEATMMRYAASIQLKAGKNSIRISNEVGGYYFETIRFESVEMTNLSEKGITMVAAHEFTHSSGDIVQDNSLLFFETDQWVEYDVFAPAVGTYDLTISAGMPGPVREVNVLVNDTDSYDGTLASTGSYETILPNVVAKMQLKAGKNRVRITNVVGGYYFESLFFEPAENPVFVDLYVSEDGSDENTGEYSSPFKTITRAKEEAKDLSDAMTGDIIIHIMPGYYQLSETEKFDETHSGKNGYNIVYRGTDPDSPPIISGGKAITGWEKADGPFWRAYLDQEETVRNLYIDGFPAVRARSKYSYLFNTEYHVSGSEYPSDGFSTSAINFPLNLSNVKDIELVWDLEWTSQRTLVEEMIVEGDHVHFMMKQPFWSERRAGSDSTTISGGDRFHIENAKELLDEPGEFYYAKDEKYIYYYPYQEQDLNHSDVYIGELEFMFQVEGSSITNKVSHLVFDNLDFRYGAWNEVSEKGLIGIQADSIKNISEDSRTMIPAQFAVNKAKNIKIQNSTFSALGSAAISMVNAVSHSEIEGNLIKDVSGSGIIIGTWDHQNVASGYCYQGSVCTSEMEIVKHITIKNNVIRRAANEYRGSVGISVYYERDIDIMHNSIMEMPYTGISVGWGWGNYDSPTSGNITVSNNYLEDTVHTLRDGAHLYTLGANPGSVIAHNYFKKSGPGGAPYGGVYTDSGSAYFKIRNNVFEDTFTMWFVGLYHTHHLTAVNNYVDREEAVNVVLRQPSNVVSNTHVIHSGEWPVEAVEIMQNAGVEVPYRHLLTKAEYPSWMRSVTKTVPRDTFRSSNNVWTEAEDFMDGGQHVGYYKIVEKPNNNHYRPDGVPLMLSPRGGYMVHQDFPGEWLKYEIEIPEDGNYDFMIKAAQAWPENEKNPGARVYINGEVVIEGLIPHSGTWNSITSYNLGNVHLMEGTHIVKIEFMNNGFYFDAFKFVGEDYIEEPLQNDPEYDEGIIVPLDPDPADPVVLADIKNLVDQFEDEGEIFNEAAVRALNLHLTAVAVFESLNEMDKVAEHMEGFTMLLNHQYENEFISELAYETLMDYTTTLLNQLKNR